MFVDASAIVAIINQESGWQELADRLHDADELHTSPLVRYEAVQAVARAGAEKKARNTRPTPQMMAEALKLIDNFMREIGAQELDISAEIGSRAINASMRYGKAVGHPAGLNFGDCFAYACAKALGAPLLYKGNDFAKTDLV